jgi:tetratricopeptide (TPR) repeat protein
MPKNAKYHMALKAYRRGAAFVNEQRFAEAIPELQQAEDLFRELDSRGRPFNRALENGVSGLANTLYLLGISHARSGDLPRAIAAFETSSINARFERTAPFRAFLRDVHQNLIACYEQTLAGTGLDAHASLPPGEPSLDLCCRFPFSLDPKLIPPARLYELAPLRHIRFREFYERARQRDAALRTAGKSAEESAMRSISIGIWSVLAAIWLAYGYVVIRTLIRHD